MKTWKARIKERGNKRILTPKYTIATTDEKTDLDMIEFWGLEKDDVEWYELELVES